MIEGSKNIKKIMSQKKTISTLSVLALLGCNTEALMYDETLSEYAETM